MDLNQKKELTGNIKDMLDASTAIYLTDFSGMTVEQVNELRDEFFKSNIKYKVIKNTLSKRALKESGRYSAFVDKLDDSLKGPTGIILANEDPVLPAKIIKKFFDKSQKPKLKSAIIEGEVYGSGKLNELASLLSKNELYAKIMGSLDSPVSGIVGSINAVIRDLANVIEEAAKKNAA